MIIDDRVFNILFVEDNLTTQKIITEFLTKTLPVSVTNHSTILGAQRFIQGEPYDSIDMIICDWMLPVWDASYIVKDLYKLGKEVIFYSCLDEKEIKENIRKILGFYPRNFNYIQKASENYTKKLSKIIKRHIKS